MFEINFLRNGIPQNGRQRVNKQRQTMPLVKVARCTQEEKERERDMSHAEVFEEMHKKMKKDGTRETGWRRVRHTYEDYHKRLEEWQQTQHLSTQPTPDEMASLWTEAAGGVNKGRVYGLGVRRPTGHPNPLLANSSSSSQNQE
ncbi:PREDICTED: uncharacterized protein LOC109206856 [Nicotiana attenuata]|uniref:uncharacterized protein LOC109206856 n=1 Tax=Nicotiana attenuata TaxID=49451 RepID=UPI000904A2C4|nr:PREDICTED: uncharacterized protein LOC109206856 [Nicotiana attenuata]